MLGVFEKGKADVRFTARSNGGHASAPPKNSPVARLAAFVDSMEKHPPFRKKFEPEVSAMVCPARGVRALRTAASLRQSLAFRCRL